MAGTTTNGLPYPDPTDPVTQGADAIKALATKLDSLLLAAGFLVTKNGSTVAAPISTWTTVPVTTSEDQMGQQPWTVNTPARTITTTAAGVYILSTTVTLSGPNFAVRFMRPSQGSTIAQAAIGGTFNTNSLTTVRYFASGTDLAVQVQPLTALNIVPHTGSTPTFFSIAAIGMRTAATVFGALPALPEVDE